MKTKVIKLVSYINLKLILKNILAFGAFYLLAVAGVNNAQMQPFAFGLYYALMFLDNNAIGYFAMFFSAYALAAFNITGLIIAVNLAVVPLLFFYLHKVIKRKVPILLACAYGLLGNVMFVFYGCTNAKNIFITLITLLIGIMFLASCMHFLKASLFKTTKTKMHLDELICGSILLMAFSLGISCLNVAGMEFDKLIGIFLILIVTYLFKSNVTIIFGTMFGLGCALQFLNAGYIAAFVCFSLCAVAFKSNYKVIPCLAIILAEVVFGLFFNIYLNFSVLSIVSVIIGEILFLLLPTKVLNNLSVLFSSNYDNVALRSIINRSKQSITKRMVEISNVFLEMDTVYKQMVQGVLPEKEAKDLLKSELFEKCCKDCPEKNKCTRVDGKFSTEVFNSITDIGYEKGRITLLDVPQYLTSRCGRVNYIISTLNSLLVSYKHYANMVNNMDASKILIADQLKGVSNLIKVLAEEVNLNISFDVNLENRIKEELSYKNISCLEALVYEQNATVKNASLIVSGDYDIQKLEKIVSKVIGSKLKVLQENNSEIGGTKEIVLKTAPNYDIVFGSSACSKNGVSLSGDTHSLIKIDDGKYMVALCDGMGSGEKAHSVSDLTITLIENFYKAGFDNETILNSVNRLLTLNADENFSALDICVFDTRKNIMDFIKLGAPYGFIKHKTETEVISTSGLPIGVLSEMQPHITKKMFSDFDIVVLVSDGISEAFGSEEELKTFINNSTTLNPQTLADDILDRAVDLVNGNCTDDFTCVAVRIYPL